MSPFFAVSLIAVAPAIDGRVDATRAVVRAVVVRAEQLRANRPKGDALTGEYVRVAARAAAAEAEAVRAAAFLIGIGVALDDTTTLRSNPLTARTVRAVESDAERTTRLRVLGEPTIRGRRDSCLHFAVSAALSELIGPAAAESAGLAKEMLDMTRAGGSGFSFADLAANFSGLAFADKVRNDPKFVAELGEAFEANEHVPAVDGLREGITSKQFAADYGTADDPRFRAAVAEVRKRVADLTADRR